MSVQSKVKPAQRRARSIVKKVTVLGCDMDLTVENGRKLLGWSKSMKAALQEEGKRLRQAGAVRMGDSSGDEGGTIGRDSESSPELRRPSDIFDELERMFLLREEHERCAVDQWGLEADLTFVYDSDGDVAV
jgi:hypothetical protein